MPPKKAKTTARKAPKASSSPPGKKGEAKAAKAKTGAPKGYEPTSRKDGEGRKVYTKDGKDYVKRKKKDGTFGMRQAVPDRKVGGSPYSPYFNKAAQERDRQRKERRDELAGEGYKRARHPLPAEAYVRRPAECDEIHYYCVPPSVFNLFDFREAGLDPECITNLWSGGDDFPEKFGDYLDIVMKAVNEVEALDQEDWVLRVLGPLNSSESMPLIKDHNAGLSDAIYMEKYDDYEFEVAKIEAINHHKLYPSEDDMVLKPADYITIPKKYDKVIGFMAAVARAFASPKDDATGRSGGRKNGKKSKK